MKNAIFALTLFSILLISGCSQQQALEATAEQAQEEVQEDDGTAGIILEFADIIEEMNVLIEPSFAYESNIKSKSMIENALKKLSELDAKTNDAKRKLSEIKKKDFEGKDEFVQSFAEFLGIIGNISKKYAEFYSYNLKMSEQQSLEQQYNMMDELHASFINCRCNKVDCESYSKSSLKFLNSSIRIFSEVRDSFKLESFKKVVETWTKEKAVAEKYWPGLIEKSDRYSERCWNINDAYSKYLAEFDSIPQTTESEIDNEIAEKWTIPIQALSEKLGNVNIRISRLAGE